ncbi:protein TBATA isoform X2 [Oryctolagus cuniculus]|uniref:protein TBATA isoform X2 n=1 Tax=Oryctolagus cuniculus TaxID=9986 RepID=UPI002230192D|nr:protein TBATA isoform X2 [Oryctolagus cuniculus]
MATEVTAQLAEHPLPSPRLSRDESRLEQETQGPGQRSPQRAQGQRALLSISRVHLYSCRGTPSSQGRQQGVQTAISPKAELKAEKKPGHRPRSQGDGGPQRELVIPGVVDFELIPETVTTPKPQTPGSYRFGRLSHHSFFSRHHPHPQHVTHIQDLTGKPVCVVRDEFSMAPLPESTPLSRCLMGMPTISSPIGDPQSNRNPQLPSEAWKRELKELSSRVATFTKENELKTQEKEEPLREQGAKYSAETGRLIPASAQAVGRRSSRQRSHRAGRDGGVQGFLLQDQDLLRDLASPGIRFSGPVGRGHRAGLQGLHLPPWAPSPTRRSPRHPKKAGLGSPHSPSEPELDLFLMLLGWRAQGKLSPEVAKTPQEEEDAARRESHAGHLAAAAAHPEPQAAQWGSPTSPLTAPDSGSSRVGRPEGVLRSPQQGPSHMGLGPGAPLSDPADRLAERHPVLATLRSPQGERPGSRTPTDSGGSAPPSASGLHPSRKAPAPAPRSPRTTTTREAAASFQSIPEENEDPTSTQKRKARVHRESAGPADALEPGQRRKTIRGKSRELRSAEPSKAPWPAWHQGSSQVWENFGPNRFNSSS